VLRAYAKYLKQVGFTFSQAYIEQTLAAHPAIAAKIVTFFHARLQSRARGEPRGAAKGAHRRAPRELRCRAERRRRPDPAARLQPGPGDAAHEQLGARCGRRAQALPVVQVRLLADPELPDPRPMFEIWVYSTRFEAIHLRGGKVARGGLRWSDRPEDFRTEILGLMKAQMVKNAVIVPVGSKGGFVLKGRRPLRSARPTSPTA
jgi:glutamate dehydrogenase